MISSRDVSVRHLWPLLPSSGEMPFSFVHPAALLLFSEGLRLSLSRTRTAGEILTGETADGVRFLPLPPRSFFHPGMTPTQRGALLFALFSELSDGDNEMPPPFLEHCPLGLLPEGPFIIERSDIEYVSAASSLLSVRGDPYRGMRWEWNRFFRDHPAAFLRPVSTADRTPLLVLFSRFSTLRRAKAAGDLDRFMAEDLEPILARALGLWEEGAIEGWIIEEEGQILGIEWVGRSADGRTLVCFLEAREEGISNLGGVLVRSIVREAGSSVRWVNAMGGADIASVALSKRIRPHDLVLPVFRVRRE